MACAGTTRPALHCAKDFSVSENKQYGLVIIDDCSIVPVYVIVSVELY